MSHFSSAAEGYYGRMVDIFANIFASGLLPLEAGRTWHPTGHSKYTNKPLNLTGSCGDSSSVR